MKSLRRFLSRLGHFATKRRDDERLRQEIAEHIALQTEENLRAGLSPVEARRQAMLKFGGVEAMKQDYRAQPGRRKKTIAEIASGLGGLSTFGVTTAVAEQVANDDKRNAANQSGRVSLGLLHDAGYDITQAPIAWWLLAKSSAHDLSSIPLPPRAANLYRSLGMTWHNYSEASTAPLPTLQTK